MQFEHLMPTFKRCETLPQDPKPLQGQQPYKIDHINDLSEQFG